MRSLLLISASLAAIAATPLHAQETAAGAEEASDEFIVVTGSRIRRPNLESAVPVTSIGGEEFFQTASLSVGDTLNDLPQLRNTFSQQNSTRFLGTRGINLLDLRGLGTQRTLVLVNGRRHVPGDVLVNGVSPDVNTFPTDLIERVDILTGGASSVYGSDAIAGVVNFILKTDYEGIQVRAQSGLSQYNDAGNRYLSLLAGKNFSDGRGNVAVNLEYAQSDAFFGSDRPHLRQNDNFVIVDTDAAGSPNGSDGIPDRIFLRDLRSSTISLGGQLGFPSATGACGRDSGTNATPNAAFQCNFLFQPDGTLVPQTGLRVGVAPNGNYIGGNGASNREGQLLTLSPNLERFSANFLGRFEISPAAVAFVEAKYVRAEAFGSQSGPFFSQGTTLGDPQAGTTGNRERPRLDNPYLTAQARSVIAGQVGSNANATRFSLRRNWVDLGIRDEEFVRETYRIVGGLRGDFGSNWNYEVSLNYGEHTERNVIKGNVNVQRYLLAIDSVRDPLSGNIVCRSRIDPGAATIDYAGNPAVLAGDVAACVPLNPFGEGSVTQAARDYLLVDSLATGSIDQFVASGFVAGDSSKWFELPGGPVGISLGGEYRRENVRYDLDDLTQQGYAFYNAIPAFTAPAFEVWEIFGEVRVPLLKDIPLIRELTLMGSGRYSDYNNATGGVFTYTGAVEWRPINDLRLRGSYARAVRSPNLSELFSKQTQNFAPGFVDPCSARNIATGSNTRAANCAAAGRPANYDFVYVQSLEIVSGGNPKLEEETSTSFTIGGVFTPQAIPGLSITVDYYDIVVDNVITSVAAQTIVNQCYDLADLNNPFCSAFTRAGAGGGPRGEEQFRIVEGSLLQSTLNFAKLTARGIDTEVSYNRSFGWGSLNLRGIWTRTLERSNFTNPADPGRENRLLSELGDPENQINFNADVKVGDVTFGYQLRWIDSMYLNTFEDFNSLQNRPPENLDYADVQRYPAVTYHDIRVGFDLSEDFNIYAGVDNLTSTKPPFGLTGVGAGSGIYDVRGRTMYAGIRAKF